MFQKFTVLARQAVVLAQDEARGLGHDWVGTEHLLLGLAREEQGLASRALASLDVTAETVRQRVVELLGRGEAAETGQLVFTPRAKQVLELALQESLALRHSWIGTEHLLLGMVTQGDGAANRILDELGAGRSRVVDAVTDLLRAEGHTDPA